MNKTTLETAVRAIAAKDRLDLDTHPSLEQLVDHRAGKLSAPDAERLQNHLALCPLCTRLVLDLAAFPRLEPADGVEPVSEQEVEVAWRKMGPELLSATESVPPLTDQELPSAFVHSVEHVRRLRRRERTFRIAAVVLAMVGALWIGALYRTLGKQIGPRYAAVIDVGTSRGPRPYLVSPQAEQILLVVERFNLAPYSRGLVEISRGSEVIVTEDLGPSPDDRSLLYLVLPREQLPDGAYRVRIFGLDATGRQLLKDVRMTLEDSSTSIFPTD